MTTTSRKTFSRTQEGMIARRLLYNFAKSVKAVKATGTHCNLESFLNDPESMDDVLNIIDPDESQRLTRKSKTRITRNVIQQHKIDLLLT